MKKVLIPVFALFCFSLVAHAQPRPNTGGGTAGGQAAPSNVPAKYEGGLFGYSEKITGSLRFDDANSRMIFVNKDQKEMFAIPYNSVLVVSPQSQSVRTTTGTVVSHIPLPGAGLAGLMRGKRRFMVVQFDDPDVKVRGIANFRINDKALLDAAIRSLGTKADLTQRGDAYYRPKDGKVPF